MSHSNESSAFNSPVNKRRKTYPELESLEYANSESIPLVPERTERFQQVQQDTLLHCPNLQDFEFKLNELKVNAESSTDVSPVTVTQTTPR